MSVLCWKSICPSRDNIQLELFAHVDTTVMDIESSVRDMVSSLKDRCPNLCPALFLTHMTPKSLEQLCSTPAQVEQVKSWLSKRNESSHSFVNEIDYAKRTIRILNINSVSELDAALTSLEATMRMIVIGSESELIVAMTRFLEANGYKGNIPEERHIFNECYNIAYAIKILIRWDEDFKPLQVSWAEKFHSCPSSSPIIFKHNNNYLAYSSLYLLLQQYSRNESSYGWLRCTI